MGVASNSRKAVINLLAACGKAVGVGGKDLKGILVGAQPNDPVFSANPGLVHVEKNPDGHNAYTVGVVGGTAWLFTRPEWEGVLDFLFIDEAGQVHWPTLWQWLSVIGLPQGNLFALYQSWLDSVLALEAAQITGAFRPPTTKNSGALRENLDARAQALRDLAALRSQAENETQLNRRVEINLAIKKLDARIAEIAQNL